MIDDVVDHLRFGHHAKRLAHPAQRMLSKVRQAGTLPLPTIPTLSSGQPFAPCVRVEHLHRLRAHLLGAGRLHGDPRLSHESSILKASHSTLEARSLRRLPVAHLARLNAPQRRTGGSGAMSSPLLRIQLAHHIARQGSGPTHRPGVVRVGVVSLGARSSGLGLS